MAIPVARVSERDDDVREVNAHHSCRSSSAGDAVTIGMLASKQFRAAIAIGVSWLSYGSVSAD